MNQSLPTAMLAHLRALGTALVEVAVAQPNGTLLALEAGVRAAVQSALPGLLGAVMQAALVDLDPAVATVQRRCPRCDRLVGLQEVRDRTLRTTCGAVTLSRPWYHCAPCQHGFSPVDAALALPPLARLSPALQGWVVRLGVAAPPREAAALLTDLTGLVVHHDTVREHTTRVGRCSPMGTKRRSPRCTGRARPRSTSSQPRARWWSRRMGRWCAPGMAGMRSRSASSVGRRTVS